MPDKNLKIPDKELFTTREVATYFSVTADAVRKWLRSGRLKAEATPGGHHRIPRVSLLTFIKSRQEKQEVPLKKKVFQYCWEFHSNADGLKDGCAQCVVYRSRTGRCFELAKLPVETGHARLFCTNTCEKCEYYGMIWGSRPSLLIVTNQSKTRRELEALDEDIDFIIKFTDTPFKCSRVLESYIPDYIVVDCTHGENDCRDFIADLSNDFRIPMARIILVGDPAHFPRECEKMVYAFMIAPLNMNKLFDLIEGR
jgi:excisionase family DNA binding protein